MKICDCRNYIVAKNQKEIAQAKKKPLCDFIVFESNNTIFLYERFGLNFKTVKYVLYDTDEKLPNFISGHSAYLKFYNYCGAENIEKMKNVLPLLDNWESFSQLHFCDYEYANTKIYEDIYVLDVNSSFSAGAMKLTSEFDLLKSYLLGLYEQKKNAKNAFDRSKAKDYQNFLIGYFARVKKFVNLRSHIIQFSNFLVEGYQQKVFKNGGKVFLSNTDSIITDFLGYSALKSDISPEIGKLKLEKICTKLYYKSPNCYQLDEKITFSGVKYFARKNTDFFKDEFASQVGSFVESYDFSTSFQDNTNLCRVKNGEIVVTVVNLLGEIIKTIIYKKE